MALKRYLIDGSSLPPEQAKKAAQFIEINAFTFNVDLTKQCTYETFWEENIDPSKFPALKNCVIHHLLQVYMSLQ